MDSKKRLINLTMFDLIRGVGIILVLIRHSIHTEVSSDLFWKMAYTVLMPVFFMISGYWMKKRPFREGFVSNVKSFLVPYAVVMGLVNLVGLIHRLLIHKAAEWFEIFLMPSLLVYSGSDTRIGAMWFVFSLFVGWTIVYGLFLLKNEKVELGVSVIICLIGTVILPLKPPFQLAQGMYAQFFLWVGYLIKKKKLLEKKLPIPIVTALLLIWVIGGYITTLENRCDFAFYLWGDGMPAVICCVCGSFLILYYGIRLNQQENRLTETLGLLGRYTFWILCVHSFEGAVVPWKYLFRFVAEDSVQGTIAQLVLRSIFIYCGCIVIRKYQTRRKRYAG